MKVLKYGPLKLNEDTELYVPSSWDVAHFGVQQYELYVWLVVDDSHDAKVTFHVAPTGKDMPNKYSYLYSCNDSEFVWHLFWKYSNEY